MVCSTRPSRNTTYFIPQVKDRPDVLDDALVAHVIRVYRAQLEDHGRCAEQLAQWAQRPLPATETHEMERLGSQVQKLGEVLQAMLA